MSSTAIMDHEPVGAKPMLQDHTNAKAAPASAREEVKIEEHEPREPTNGAGQQPAKTAEATAGGTSAGGDSPKHTRGEKQIKVLVLLHGLLFVYLSTAQQSLHRGFTRTHPSGGSSKLFWENWRHLCH